MNTMQPENFRSVKTPAMVLGRELIVTSARPMKERQFNTKDWEKFLEFESMGDRQLEGMMRCCARFCWRIKDSSEPSWLAILGDSGTGKTHCARKVWDYARKRFQWSACDFVEDSIYWPEFVGRLRDVEDKAAKYQLKDMMRWPVLFLDDIGAEKDTTGFASEQLCALLGKRVGKWTILTSNLPLHKLAEIDVRISDRIVRENGNELIELENLKSYSLRKREMAHAQLPPSDRD